MPIILGVILFMAGLGLTGAAAQPAARPLEQAAPLHPQFALLDANEVNVLTSGQPVSTLKTCGACHDTAFIQSHSDHASVGLDEFGQPGTVATAAPGTPAPALSAAGTRCATAISPPPAIPCSTWAPPTGCRVSATATWAAGRRFTPVMGSR